MASPWPFNDFLSGVPSGMRLVTSAACPGKENGVQHQIKLRSVVAAPLHQRNLAAFSPAAFDARHRFFSSSQVHRQRGVSVMADFPL
jgi:hypothetical protein